MRRITGWVLLGGLAMLGWTPGAEAQVTLSLGNPYTSPSLNFGRGGVTVNPGNAYGNQGYYGQPGYYGNQGYYGQSGYYRNPGYTAPSPYYNRGYYNSPSTNYYNRGYYGSRYTTPVPAYTSPYPYGPYGVQPSGWGTRANEMFRYNR